MEDSAVGSFRRPRRVQPDERDRELAAIVANVPGAIYRCALDDDVHHRVRAATSADRPYALEYRIVRADGTTRWVLERGQRVNSDAKTVSGELAERIARALGLAADWFPKT